MQVQGHSSCGSTKRSWILQAPELGSGYRPQTWRRGLLDIPRPMQSKKTIKQKDGVIISRHKFCMILIHRSLTVCSNMSWTLRIMFQTLERIVFSADPKIPAIIFSEVYCFRKKSIIKKWIGFSLAVFCILFQTTAHVLGCKPYHPLNRLSFSFLLAESRRFAFFRPSSRNITSAMADYCVNKSSKGVLLRIWSKV